MAADAVADVSDVLKGNYETIGPLWDAVKVKWQKRGVVKDLRFRMPCWLLARRGMLGRPPFSKHVSTALVQPFINIAL